MDDTSHAKILSPSNSSCNATYNDAACNADCTTQPDKYLPPRWPVNVGLSQRFVASHLDDNIHFSNVSSKECCIGPL